MERHEQMISRRGKHQLCAPDSSTVQKCHVLTHSACTGEIVRATSKEKRSHNSAATVRRGSRATPSYPRSNDAECMEMGEKEVHAFAIGQVQVANRSSHPNRAPKKPFDDDSFFSASATSCNAFCSLSAISTTSARLFLSSTSVRETPTGSIELQL